MVETTNAHSFMAAANALEKAGIPFRAEKDYTADLVDGRSFLSPFVWTITVEEEQREAACEVIEEGGGSAYVEVPDEDEVASSGQPEQRPAQYYIALFYGALLLLGLVLTVWRMLG